ncbi:MULTISPECIES: hypothetical protein [Bacillaceae]|uniref:Uncharacterized protein n=1 Tax=Domibacillus aminovorans TaxID=29332 RepID=A0A177KN70_9BACI|nr:MULTISPECIES: hypothetical protein [Bacillaceae]OAH54577.1 hypothetical protein AWH48_08275 [Domibacillus aminovorans]
MDGSKDCRDGLLVFSTKENAECCIRLMTLFKENAVIDAEFMKPSYDMEREWLLGEKGTIKITASENGNWKELLIHYCLKEGIITVIAIKPSYLSVRTISSIASQFFIRKGNMLQFLAVRSIGESILFKNKTVRTVSIYTK